MAQPIFFTITQAGKNAVLNAATDAPTLNINLVALALGAGKYTPVGNETALISELQRNSIISGDVETISNTLRFSSSVTASSVTDVYEVGLVTDDDVLFAVAASSTDPLFTLHPDITFIADFGLSLADVAADSVTVTTDPNGALSIFLMQQHLAAPDPHPQYASGAQLASHLSNPDAHEQYLKTSDFVHDHLNHEDPHDQYVRKTVYDNHVADNNKEHTALENWQAQHSLVIDADGYATDPHPQYVPMTLFNQRISELLDLIRGLMVDGGTGNELISVLHLSLVASGSARTTEILEALGFEFEGYTDLDALGVYTGKSQNVITSRSYSFVFMLPSEYNSDLHRIVATGGDSHTIDKDNGTVAFRISTSIRSYHVNRGDDEYTEYSSGLGTNLRVELYGPLEAPIPSGTVLGRMDARFTGGESNFNNELISEKFDVHITDFVADDGFTLIRVGNFATSTMSDVQGGYHDFERASRIVELDYPAGFDTSKYQVVGNVDEVIEKEDGSGIYFYLDYRLSSGDGGSRFVIDQRVYLKIVAR